MTAARKVLGAAAWTASAAALLAIGFLAWVNLGAWIATRAQPDAALQVRTAFELYAYLVLFKALLPALLVALALWPLLDWSGWFSRRGRPGLALGLALAATLGSVVVAAALMPVTALGLPTVQFTGPVNFVRTCLELAAAVTLAAWIPRSVRPRTAALAAASLIVVFVAGGAALIRWPRTQAPPATPNAGPSVPTVPDAAAPTPGPSASPEVAVPLEPDRVASSDPAPGVGGPDAEEIARRREMASRIRKLIAEGKDALEPPVTGGVLAEGDPSPVYENGELLGVELQNLRPGGFYARLGLRDGDLVQSINGVGLQSINDMELDASGKLLEEFVSSPRVELQVERSDGTQGVIAVTREEIIQRLIQLEN